MANDHENYSKRGEADCSGDAPWAAAHERDRGADEKAGDQHEARQPRVGRPVEIGSSWPELRVLVDTEPRCQRRTGPKPGCAGQHNERYLKADCRPDEAAF